MARCFLNQMVAVGLRCLSESLSEKQHGATRTEEIVPATPGRRWGQGSMDTHSPVWSESPIMSTYFHVTGKTETQTNTIKTE